MIYEIYNLKILPTNVVFLIINIMLCVRKTILFLKDRIFNNLQHNHNMDRSLKIYENLNIQELLTPNEILDNIKLYDATV